VPILYGMRLIAFVTEVEPARPPPISLALARRRNTDCVRLGADSTNDSEQGEPAPEFEFDQTVSW